jgi:hypothetical protein
VLLNSATALATGFKSDNLNSRRWVAGVLRMKQTRRRRKRWVMVACQPGLLNGVHP